MERWWKDETDLVFQPTDGQLTHDLRPANIRLLWADFLEHEAPHLERREIVPWLWDYSGREITDRYDFHPPVPGFPRFRVVHHAKSPLQNDRQYAITRSDTEGYHRLLGFYLGFAQYVCSAIGKWQGCSRAGCRRKSENDWSFPGPWMPPCVEFHEIDFVRPIVRSWIDWWNQKWAGKPLYENDKKRAEG
jgi:hypothetical protein